MRKLVFIFFILLLISFGLYFILNKKKIEVKELPKVFKNKTSSLIKEKSSQNPQSETVSQNESQVLSLEIIEPQNNITVNNSRLTVKGKTNPNIEVFINDEELISDGEGNFEAVITLDEGENIITIVASDSQGNYVEKELIVNFESIN